MQKKHITFLFFSQLILIATVGRGQQVFKASIKTYNHEPPNGAYVAAYADSLQQEPVYTNYLKDKEVAIKIPDSLSCFYLSISHLQYKFFQKKFCKPFSKKQNIILQKRITKLDEFVFNGSEKTKVSMKGTIATLYPGEIIRDNKGLKAANMLKILPEVFVLPGNKVILRGHTIKKIYLHNGISSIKSSISFDRLKSMKAKEIKKITVDYLKSEIDVYLKKVEKPGYAFNNELDLSQGRKFYGSLSPDLKLKNKNTYYWINTHIGWIHKRPESSGEYMIEVPLKANKEMKSVSHTEQKQKYIHSNLYIEHHFDSVYSGGIQISHSATISPTKNHSLSTSDHSISTKAETFDHSHAHSLSPSFYLQSKYAHHWTFTLNAGLLTSLQKSVNKGSFDYLIDEQATLGRQHLQQKIRTKGYVTNFKGQKKWKSTTLSLSIKGYYLNSKTSSNYLQNLLGHTSIDSAFTNLLKERDWKITADLNTTLWKKYILRLSSSLPFYQYKYKDKNIGTITKNNIKKLLPALSISIPLKKSKYLTLFGNSYMKTPSYSNIIFNSLSKDGYTENKNNNALKPYITYQTGVSYSFLENLNSSLYWSKTNNKYMNYPYFSEEGAFLGNRKINLSKSNALGLSVFYSNTLFKHIYVSVNTNFSYQSWKNKKKYAFSTNFASLLGNLSLYYSSDTHWSLNVDYTYSSRQKLSDKISLHGYSLVNIEASKQLNKHWSLFCNINNALNTYHLNVTSNTNQIHYKSLIDFDALYVTLGINYEIKNNFKKKRTEMNPLKTLEKHIKVKKALQ